MEIKEALEKIRAIEGGAEIVLAVEKGIEAQRLDASKAANGEAKGLRARAKAAEDRLEKLGDTLSVDLKGGDDEDFISRIDGVKAKFDSAGKDSEKIDSHPLVLDLKSKLASASKERDKFRGDFEITSKKMMDSKISAELSKALKSGDLKVADPFLELVSDKLSKQVALSSDGESLVFRNGDEVLNLSDGVQKYLNGNKHVVHNSQNPGGGSGQGGGQGGGPGNSPIKVTREQMKDGDWYAKNRDAVMKNGVEYVEAQ